MVMNTQNMIDYIIEHDDDQWITGLIQSGHPLLAMALCDVRHGRDCADIVELYAQMMRVSDYGDCV